MSKISLKSSSKQHSLQHINLPISGRRSNHLLDTIPREKWPKKDSKPFSFCCSLDHFDPFSRYNQRKPPYKSSLTAITSVHECPVVKMQMKFSMSQLSREKKKLIKTKTLNEEEQQLKNDRLNYSQINRNNRFIRQYLEDQIALAKDIFWAEKQKIYNEKSKKAIKIAKEKNKKRLLKLEIGPRWYQDFSPDQMKNLMKLENVMLTDYEETKTDGTQMTLIAIGVISTFFKLKPSTIRELHKSCNLNSVDFLREIYKILTGNDFCEEGYKKIYDCNERIILSAIAFLTLPETMKELHKRLPVVTMPRLPSKPKLTYLARQKHSCPYKEELFIRPNWAGYRNALQKWRKHCKLIAIPKVVFTLNKYDQFFINDESEIKKRRKDISIEYLEEINTKELQKISLMICDQKSKKNNTDTEYNTDSSKEKNLETGKSASTFNIFQPNDDKKSSFESLSKKSETMEHKIYGPPSPPEASQKSWLGKKDPYYIIAGVSTEDSHYPVTYEIAGVANVTPSNSDERFFAVLKLDQPKKVFPSGRENLSINWQEWLQNADESYRQLEEQTDELIKSVQEIMKSAFPGPVCDSCCPCRQFKKFEQKLQQSKTLNDITQDEKKNIHTDTDPMVMQSLELNPTELSINEIGLEDKIKTNMYQPIKNVPPCSCPIQQMAEDIIPSIEYIPWMKEELCPGKKYRPNKPGAYSCKMYPGNKFCKYNPFIKEIMKMKEQKIEKHKEEKEKEMKEKTEIVEITNKENQFSKKDIIEKKENKFVSNPDYPAYNNPWNISRTNDRQNDISSNELKKIKNDALDKNNNEEISLKSSNNFQKQMDRERKEIKDIHNTKKESISKEITIDKKNTKLSNTTSKMGKNQKPESLLSNKPIRQFNKINNLTKHSFVQKNRKKNVVDEIEKMENRKREIARLKNMFKFTGILDGIQPAVLPEKLASNQHNPKENTEIDSSVVNERNIKYSISSVAEDISMSPPQKIIDDPKMSTPFQTPSSSKKDILPIAGLHHHWSPMNIPSGPLQREDTALKEEMKRRKKAKDEAFKLIYGGKNEQDTYLTTRNDQEIFDKQKLMKKVGKRKDNTKESHISIKKETSKEIIRSLNKKISNKIGHQRDVSRKEITDKMIHENKYSEEIVDEIDNQQNVSHKQEKAEGKINDRSRWMNDDKKYKNNNSDLIEIMKIELKKMAAEDYTFAKLPKCYLMPQLQNWIMCREGVVFSETDKKNLMRATCSMWNLIDTNMRAEIKTPSLHMTKHQLSKLTFDQAERLKKKIEKIKAIFHSEVRKKRVLYARMMWNTMEYEKFPSASFKRTFFTYMASKEADKHVYKPWLPSEVRKRDPEFCC